MNTMPHWSPTRQFHFHHDVDDLSEKFFGGDTDETAQRPSWPPAAEGRMEDDACVIQLALPGVDPKTDHDTAGKEYFVREVSYGAFERSFALPDGVNAATMPTMIEVKAI